MELCADCASQLTMNLTSMKIKSTRCRSHLFNGCGQSHVLLYPTSTLNFVRTSTSAPIPGTESDRVPMSSTGTEAEVGEWPFQVSQ